MKDLILFFAVSITLLMAGALKSENGREIKNPSSQKYLSYSK